jgi:hypothetical protein
MNDLAYLVGYKENESRMYVLDVRDPGEPIPVGQFTQSGQAYTIAVEGNSVYFAGAETPLKILQTPFNTAPVLPPRLSISVQSGLKLNLQGRRGLHYDLEFAGSLVSPQWQYVQRLLLTNDMMTITAPVGPGTRFFRLKQLD